MDQKDFTKALITALSTDKVVKCLRKAIGDEILKEVRVLSEIVKKKEEKIIELELKANKLEMKVDELEQYSRRNSLRVTGLPERDGEDVTAMCTKLITDDLCCDSFSVSSIDRIHRVGPKRQDGKSRPILIKFATYRDRALVYGARRELKKCNGDVFINEDLSQMRSTMLYKLRQLKKGRKIVDCWSADGQILVKDKHRKILTVMDEDAILRLTGDEH